MAQLPKFSLYNAGLQDKIFAVDEDHPSPPRPQSARSRVSTAKSVHSKRPGSAGHPRARGTQLKPQSGDHHSSAQPMQPMPPGQARKKHGDIHKKETAGAAAAAVDMRAYQVLGREELLGQLMAAKKKQAASESTVHQLKAENQRLESEVSKQQHRIDKILSPQFAKSTHLVLEIRKEIEKSVLVRQLKAQMTALRSTIAEKDAQLEGMHSTLSSTTLLELSAEKEEYLLEIARLSSIVAQKDAALQAAQREAQWCQDEQREHESGDHLRHELDRLTRGYEEVLHRLEGKTAAAAAGGGGGHGGDAASVKSGASRKSARGRPKSSGSARPSSGGGGGKSGSSAPPEASIGMNKVSSLTQLDPELTTFAQQYEEPRQTLNHADSLTNINNEQPVSVPFNSGFELNEGSNVLLGESVDNIPNGGKMQIVADAMDGNLSELLGGLPLGCKVTADYRGEGAHYKGTIARQHGDNSYDVQYDDGDVEVRVARESIRVLGEPPAKQQQQSQQSQQSHEGYEQRAQQRSEQPQEKEKVVEEEERFDFQEGARVDLIAGGGQQGEAMQTGTVVAVLREGRAFSVELDSGEVRKDVPGGLLHRSLQLAEALNTINEKHNQAKFVVGDKVEACYRGKSKWYPGAVAKVRAEGFDIDYDDGEKEYNVKEDLIRAVVKEAKTPEGSGRSPRRTLVRKFRIGQRVEGNYRGRGKWLPGEISKVRTEGFDIDYDDGEREYNVKDELIRAEPVAAQVVLQEVVLQEVVLGDQTRAEKAKYSSGSRVEANHRGKGRWYPGNIGKVRAEGFDVEYDDGEKEYNVKEALIRPLGSSTVQEREEVTSDVVQLAKFVVGDKVEACYRGKSKWYPGAVAKVRAEGFDIDYDDGEKEYNVKEDLIRAVYVSNDRHEGGDKFNDTLGTTGESSGSEDRQAGAGAGAGGSRKPKQQLATNDDLNDFLNGLGSDDESELPDYGGEAAGLLTAEEEQQGAYDYGNDFEED